MEWNPYKIEKHCPFHFDIFNTCHICEIISSPPCILVSFQSLSFMSNICHLCLVSGCVFKSICSVFPVP